MCVQMSSTESKSIIAYNAYFTVFYNVPSVALAFSPYYRCLFATRYSSLYKNGIDIVGQDATEMKTLIEKTPMPGGRTLSVDEVCAPMMHDPFALHRELVSMGSTNEGHFIEPSVALMVSSLQDGGFKEGSAWFQGFEKDAFDLLRQLLWHIYRLRWADLESLYDACKYVKRYEAVKELLSMRDKGGAVEVALALLRAPTTNMTGWATCVLASKAVDYWCHAYVQCEMKARVPECMCYHFLSKEMANDLYVLRVRHQRIGKVPMYGIQSPGLPSTLPMQYAIASMAGYLDVDRFEDTEVFWSLLNLKPFQVRKMGFMVSRLRLHHKDGKARDVMIFYEGTTNCVNHNRINIRFLHDFPGAFNILYTGTVLVYPTRQIFLFKRIAANHAHLYFTCDPDAAQGLPMDEEDAEVKARHMKANANFDKCLYGILPEIELGTLGQMAVKEWFEEVDIKDFLWVLRQVCSLLTPPYDPWRMLTGKTMERWDASMRVVPGERKEPAVPDVFCERTPLLVPQEDQEKIRAELCAWADSMVVEEAVVSDSE